MYKALILAGIERNRARGHEPTVAFQPRELDLDRLDPEPA